jgi:hypothetical protein
MSINAEFWSRFEECVAPYDLFESTGFISQGRRASLHANIYANTQRSVGAMYRRFRLI